MKAILGIPSLNGGWEFGEDFGCEFVDDFWRKGYLTRTFLNQAADSRG